MTCPKKDSSFSDSGNGANGRLYGGKTVEELKTDIVLKTQGITPVTKTLVAHLMTEMPILFLHGKAEDMVIIDANTPTDCHNVICALW